MKRAIIPMVLVHDHGCDLKIEKLLTEHGIDVARDFTAHVDPQTSAWVVEQEDEEEHFTDIGGIGT